jgi:hypothetical protein
MNLKLSDLSLKQGRNRNHGSFFPPSRFNLKNIYYFSMNYGNDKYLFDLFLESNEYKNTPHASLES